MGNKFLAGIIAGALAGAAAAVMLAPKSGRESRRVVGERVGSLRRRFRRGQASVSESSSNENGSSDTE